MSRRFSVLAVYTLLAAFSLGTLTADAAESWPADAPTVPGAVRRAMQDRNYAEAVKAIDAAATAKDAPRDYLAYLKGRALALQGRYDEAAAAFDAMQKDFPKSQWLRRARFAKAVALARKGDFRAAEPIVRAEAEYLLSIDRKQQTAGIYIEFADALFKPAKEDEKPDYAKALEFYRKALEAGPKPEKRIEVEMRAAQCLQNMQKFGDAVPLYEKFLKDHPGGWLELEAMFRLGECHLAEGNGKLARRVWQDLLVKYVDGALRSERIAEAQFQLAHTWNIPNPENDEQLNLGVSAHRAFIERYPDHKLAAVAQLEIARAYMKCNRLEDAAAALKQFLNNPRYQNDREEIPAARNLLGRCYQTQKKYAEAIATWREYLAKHPAHKDWSDVQQAIIDTEYQMAVEKLTAKEFDAANRLFAEFLVKYPLDRRAPATLLLMNGKAVEEKNWDEAIAAWRRLVSKYPQAEEASAAQYAIAETLETKLGQFEKAIEEYNKITAGPRADQAKQAVARLSAKSMTVATERVFRTDETPRLKLVSRNVESVTVRIFRIDMETYFRKMHTAGGVESLDISLIDPDRTFEFKTPGYVKHKLLENAIDVPLPGGAKTGAMAVTVSSKTLEATTLVVQSDLDAIVKSSRDEVFVFAENMRTGKPWPSAKLLISNGKQVFAEGATGADGVFQRSYKELKDAADVRVFAVADGNMASNAVNLQGVGAAQGLTDRGYIYTDRPAYRAGQMVQVRGCVRRAVGDVYTIENGKKFTLTVVDPRGRLLWEEPVKLGEFGSFSNRFTLPAACPQGQCKVSIRDDAGQVYNGDFTVHEYHLEPMRLTIDSVRSVYYRGEEIEGVIRVAYYYGAPLAGRTIQYQLADDRQYTATTDAKGEAHFKLPTREYSETQVLRLTVSMPEQNLRATKNYLLSSCAFSIQVSAVRPVYVAGETFEATVKTIDAENKPTGEKLVLKLFEQTTTNGVVGERLVEEHPIATAADGTVRQTLKIAKGGNYIVRVEGIDRLKNAVSGECGVWISGDEDRTRLRILADSHTFKAGDTAAVKVHWRERPALALVAFQGAGVLDYRLVELNTGVNELSIPMTARLAPNFDLAISVMTEGKREKGEKGNKENGENVVKSGVRFHEATSPFSVERDLRVKLAVRPKNAKSDAPKPGDEVEVTVTTTDPQGRPVATEVSLAAVEQSLLDRFGDHAAPIHEFFRGPRRESAVRTTSSVTFAYAPATHPIDPRLLAEEDRLAVEAEEETSRLAGQAERRAAAGRDTQSLMLGVTPRIVIQDEEEEKLGVESPFGGETNARERFPVFSFHVGFGRDGARSFQTLGRNYRIGDTDYETSIDLITSSIRPEDWQPAFSRTMPAGSRAEMAAARNAQLQAARRAMMAEMMAETAYWNPSIVTGPTGTATVSFTLPNRSTAWRLSAVGITVDTLAGEADQPLVVKKELFGQLKLSQQFTDGDRSEVIASIHNDAVEKGAIEVSLKTTIGGKIAEEKKTVAVAAKGICEVAFPVKLEGAGKTALFELTVSSGKYKDILLRTVPIAPHGVPVYSTVSGVATTDTSTFIQPPQGMKLERSTLTVTVGPTAEQSMLDVLFGFAPACQIESCRLASDVETTTSDLMAAVAAQKMLGATRDAAGPWAAPLDARIRSAVGQLMASQGSNAAWNWATSNAGRSDCRATARAVWALSLARKAGYVVEPNQLGKAISRLQSQLTQTADGDLETKAILLHSLCMAEKGDFALANRLHRDRNQLSPLARTHLALALVEMDRKPMAVEALDWLTKEEKIEDGSAVELQALRVLALEQVAPRSLQTKAAVDWLMAHRVGSRWSPDRATGPAALALCQWFAESRFAGDHYKLDVLVNGTRVETMDVVPGAKSITFDATAAMLANGLPQRVVFQLTGRGRYCYQCILGGFVPADKLKSTTDEWKITRTYEPAPLEIDGRPVSRGFGVVAGTYKEYNNPLTQLPVGRRGTVSLKIVRKNERQDVPAERLEYLVVTEPIPAGVRVVDGTVRGGFERFELSPGAITFFIGNNNSPSTIYYDIVGYLPGDYRAGPAVVRNAHRPDEMAVSTPKSLAVLPLGATSQDEYRLSPQELLELGLSSYRKGDLKTAGQRLTELMKAWKLRPDAYKQAVQTLLDVHLEIGPPAEVVRYFEIVKEKWPQEEISFAKIMKVGAAYQEMGEFERSYLVFRATVESNFRRESGVAGFLDAQGCFTRSVDVMSRLLRDYPPEGYTAEAAYALAQHVSAKAEEVATAMQPSMPQPQTGSGFFSVGPATAPTAPTSPPIAPPPVVSKPEIEKLNRVDLQRRAWAMLESFLTEYPDDPAADQAALAAAGVLLDLKAYGEAAAACELYAKRYPKSELLDSYWYVIGYSNYAAGRHEAAIDMCRKVAETKRTDPATGRETDCRSKWQAIYILGQVYHSLGRAADAIREYRRVEDRYADARQSIDYFSRKSIELPETVEFKPGEPANVEFKFRNVAACDLKVYRIDLMKFGLLKRNLAGIAQINLAGIRPLHATAVALGDGKDYRDRVHKLSLPLKEEGAYLIVCRGDDLHTSGLALVTPLAVEVQTDAASGRVRTTVKDRVADKYLHDVQVKVIGGGNEEFVSGQTDLRGVFTAEGIRGSTTVIAQAGSGRYAFYRAKESAAEAAMRQTAAILRQPGPTTAAPGAEQRRGQTGVSLAGDDSPGAKKIREALDSPTQFEFMETPLQDVIDYLKNLHKIEIQLDTRALKDIGIGTDAPVTRNMKGVTLKEALQFVLRDLGLTYIVTKEVLLITTPEEADSQLVTKAYPVADLVLVGGDSQGEGAEADFESLIDILSGTVKPTSWEDVGGPGTIRENPISLSIVISQTQEAHEDIETLLAQLRKVMKEQGIKGMSKWARPKSGDRPGGLGGGMGGSMGGAAGMGGMGGAAAPSRRSPSVRQSEESEKTDLLQGVKGANESNRSKQSGKLKGMYQGGGMGGVNAGDAF